MKKEQPVGIFDSGVGGLTVALEVARQLPQERMLYFGDTAHVPYGSRSPSDLTMLADRIVAFLLNKGARLIIDACNSTSSVALPFLKEKYNVPIVGVVDAGAREAARVTKNFNVGLIGTETTVFSQAHEFALLEIDPRIRLYGVPCPLFVPLVEAGEVESEEAEKAARAYLSHFEKRNIDTIILGCTHYPFLKPLLAKFLGPEVIMVDPAAEVVREVKEALVAADGLNIGLLPASRSSATCRFFVSHDAESFVKVAQKLVPNWPSSAIEIEEVNLDPEESNWGIANARVEAGWPRF